ncbi:50S ribosomal protein L6 [Patescibacteria group bacterium]|nr:50S ribosomal protein L6 [Patescibacteria group bacterium]MBU1703520.1 50S ribosomal protein L6 [Patescibacteria group bacterium]MBU1953427.1 50S ribosomal protein L6 [Patescibacteria group bacterium]
MSRIGKLPITVPNGVTVEKRDGNVIFVKGPKGELSLSVHELMNVEIKDNEITVIRSADNKQNRSLHGLSRMLIANMIEGVTKGFEKRLEIQGVGYRAAIQGRKAVLSLGFSHPIEYNPPEGVTIAVDQDKKNIIIVSGYNKQLVGEAAAKIRSFRKPEPYKGKGIRYENEYVQRKAGKAAGKE